MYAPIVIGGSGHSGTRIFAQTLISNGVFMGIPRLTLHADSYDLKIINLLSTWIVPYRSGSLTDRQRQQMKQQFQRRLWMCLPFRARKWGFKNPRTILLLPFLRELFPDFKFVHVVRDGRDICFGNPFANDDDVHPSLFLTDSERHLSSTRRMMLYWGRSNLAAKRFGEEVLKDHYTMIRFEDLCADPGTVLPPLLRFAGCSVDNLTQSCALVRRPPTIGRWQDFDPVDVEATVRAGAEYLAMFGYDTSHSARVRPAPRSLTD